MSENDEGTDLAGIGKLAEAIPEKAWIKLVNTACTNFNKLLSPITASTFGLGKLIQAKFDGMVDIQKILAADTVAKAKNKIENSQQQTKSNPRAIVIIKAIENSSNETDENIRELWANLIANELISNDIHPEFIRILERLNTNDAVVLAEIAETTENLEVLQLLKHALFTKQLLSISISSFLKEDIDFSREHMSNLNLIRHHSGSWKLTLVGESFLKSVADPALIKSL